MVAQIDEEQKFATLQEAIDAATEGQTVTLIANITETATYTISKQITIDLGEYSVTGNHTNYNDKMFAITSTGNLTVTGTGSILDNDVRGIFYNEGTLTISSGTYTTTNNDGYAVIYNTGSNANCTVSGGTFTGAYAAVYNVSEAKMTVTAGAFSAPNFGMVIKSGATLNVNAGSATITSTNSTGAGINVVDANTTATISGGTITGHNGVFIMTNAKLIVNDGATITGSNASITGRGNAGEGNTTITINGGTMTSDDTGIYHPQIDGHLTINGGTITGGKLGVEIRSGELSVTGGSIKANATEYSCTPNGNGTTTVGAALAIAQHTTKQNIAVTISGGTFTGKKAISESNPQHNDPAPQVTMSVTDGTFNGGLTVEDVQGGFISGGTFDQAVPEEYCAEGFIPTDDGKGHYGVKEGSYVAKIGETKYETIAEAIAAAPDATETTIKILADIDTNISIPADKNIALTIGTHTLSGAITNAGTLAISDGTITGNITNTGTLNISGGAIEGTITKTDGTISITGGTFTNEPEAEWIASGYEVMNGAESKYVVAEEGTAESKIVTVVDEVENTILYQTIALAIAAVSDEAEVATTIVVLKDIDTAFEIPTEKKIALSITTHTIFGNITNNGTLTISDGTFTGTITNNGTLNITGGTFTNKPTGEYSCPDGKDLIINAEGKYVVTDIASAEAEIDGNMYLTIGDAISAAGTKETTITLLKDLEGEDRSITIPATANITLVIANGKTLTKPVNVDGKLAITSGTISETTTLTITNFSAVLKITDGVTHPAVALSLELQTENVLKSKAVGAITTYWAEKKFEANIDEGIAKETPEWSAAADLIANTSIKEVTGHATNQSLTITVTSVELTDSKVTKAEFEVKLIGTDGEEVTGTVDPAVTFRLPVSDELNGQWANLWHDATAIPGMDVVGATNGYVTVTTTSFSPFSYEIIETPIAQIGETKYGTVADAIDDVTESLQEATEIILVGTETNVTESITVTENKNVKLTIGTHTITDDIINEGILNIADGTIEGADKTITNTGALTISGTAIISNPVTATAGTLTISGGAISNTIETSDAAALTISNGTITGALTVGGSGTNTISGGVFAEALTATAGTLTISGGTFNKAGDNATQSTGGTINITGGTFNNTTADAITPTSGSINISGGTFTLAPVSTLCVAGYLPLKNDASKFDVKDRWDIVDDTDLSLNPHLAGGGYSVKTAEYQRHNGMVSAGNADTKYGTICMPFAIIAQPTGMTLYRATSIAGSTLTITPITYDSPVSAGTPLIFELSAVASSMTVTSTDDGGIAVNTTAPATTPVTTSGSENLLVGTYTSKNITTGLSNLYYLNGDTFHQALSSLTVPAYRAYLDVSGSGGARPLVFDIVNGENDTTSINTTEALDGVTAIYDLNGRKLNSLQRGMNIMRRADGSTLKVMVK